MFKIVVIVASLAQDPAGYIVTARAYPTMGQCQKHIAAAVARVQSELPGNLYKAGCLSVEEIEKIVNGAKAEGSI